MRVCDEGYNHMREGRRRKRGKEGKEGRSVTIKVLEQVSFVEATSA